MVDEREAADANPPLTPKEVLEHIAICPDGCGVCRTMAKETIVPDINGAIRILDRIDSYLRDKKVPRQNIITHVQQAKAALTTVRL